MKIAAWIVIGICLLPTLVLFALSIGDPGYREILAQERQTTLLLRSLWVSALATLLALVWGTLVALGARSLRGVAGALFETVSMLPLLLPSIVLVMGWIFFFGANGPAKDLKIDIFTEWGTAFVMSMAYYPCVSILLLQAFRHLDPAWTAAASLHAGPWRVMWRVWRPLVTPYLATGAMLVFLLSLSDYGIPSALRVNVYPVEIFTQMSAYFNVPKAVAFCVPPLIVAVALIVLRRVLVSPTSETIGHRHKAYAATGSRAWAAAAAPIVFAGVALPLWMLVRTQGKWSTLPEALTIAGDQAIASLFISAYATILLVVAGAVVGIALRRGGLGLEIAATLSLIIPGAVVGLGIVVLYTKGWLPASIYRSPASLSFAMLCRFILFPALTLGASFAAIRARMTEAAAVSGVSARRSLFGVTLPLALPGLAAAALLSFVLCLGELSASALVNPPGQMTLAMRIASLLHFGEDRIVASLCLTLSALVVGTLTLGTLLLNRRLEFRLDADRS